MAQAAGFLLNLAFFLLLFVSGTHSTTFLFKNNCPYTVWPGVLGNSGSPAISSSGFVLNSGGSYSLGAPPSWSGRFWARTGCSSSGTFSCATANCGPSVSCNGAGGVPPATLAEFTLNGSGNKDNYDVSLVDGFNIPMSIVPQGSSCPSRTCSANINSACPSNLAVRSSSGSVIACKSACLEYNTPQDCCTGAHNTAATCPPQHGSAIFQQQCPQAYSYAYDDRTALVTCPSGPNYLITFCP